jgi:glycosyltransferase involved in cell wall biosynthesis
MSSIGCHKKRILHVVNVYFVLPYFLGEQLLYLKNQGFDVHIVCSPSPHIENYSLKMQFKYKEIGILKAISPLRDCLALLKICYYIKKNKIDIVIGHTPKGGFLAMIAASLTGVRLRIYFRHGLLYETMKGTKRFLIFYAEKITSCFASKIVCVSPSLARKSLEDNLNPAIKQIVILKGTCGGIDTKSKFNPETIDNGQVLQLRKTLKLKDEDFVIGYVGRLVRDKGIIDLIQAFFLLNEMHPDKSYKLLLVGGFEKRDCLPQIIVDKIKEAQNIIWTGFILEKIEVYYTLMDVLILPSYREGFGMSILEASAMKVPVLTTKATGCIDSIVEGETGRYISHSEKSIIEGILYYTDEKLARDAGNKGREFVCQNFDNSILWPEILKLYTG